MRRDAVRQLRTVAGHQTAAAPQEEAAGIGGGQEAKARHAAHVSREGVVLLHAVVRHDRGRLGLRAAVPGAAVRGPGRVHAAGRLCARPGAVHDGTPRRVGRTVQLHVELVPRGLHQRCVQVHAHLRGVPRRRRRPDRARSRAAGQHKRLRVPARSGLRQFHRGPRPPGRHVPVPLFPAEPHAGRGRLRQAAAVRRYCPLLRRPVHHMHRHVHRAVRHALRLSDRRSGRAPGPVQELSRTLAHRGIQVSGNVLKRNLQNMILSEPVDFRSH